MFSINCPKAIWKLPPRIKFVSNYFPIIFCGRKLKNKTPLFFQDDNTLSTLEDGSQSSNPDLESEVFSPSATTASTSSNVTSVSQKTLTTRVPKRKNKADQVLDIVATKLQAPAARPQQYESFAKHIAEQMRQVSSEQAIYLTKIINDAVFEAQCGSLTKNSHIVNFRQEQRHFTPYNNTFQNTSPRRSIPAEQAASYNFKNLTEYGGYQRDRGSEPSTSLSEYFTSVTPSHILDL